MFYIQLYSPHNMVAQANKTSKNTTNEIKRMTTVPPYTYKLLNSQNQLGTGLLNHLAQVRRLSVHNQPRILALPQILLQMLLVAISLLPQLQPQYSQK